MTVNACLALGMLIFSMAGLSSSVPIASLEMEALSTAEPPPPPGPISLAADDSGETVPEWDEGEESVNKTSASLYGGHSGDSIPAEISDQIPQSPPTPSQNKHTRTETVETAESSPTTSSLQYMEATTTSIPTDPPLQLVRAAPAGEHYGTGAQIGSGLRVVHNPPGKASDPGDTEDLRQQRGSPQAVSMTTISGQGVVSGRNRRKGIKVYGEDVEGKVTKGGVWDDTAADNLRVQQKGHNQQQGVVNADPTADQGFGMLDTVHSDGDKAKQRENGYGREKVERAIYDTSDDVPIDAIQQGAGNSAVGTNSGFVEDIPDLPAKIAMKAAAQTTAVPYGATPKATAVEQEHGEQTEPTQNHGQEIIDEDLGGPTVEGQQDNGSKVKQRNGAVMSRSRIAPTQQNVEPQQSIAAIKDGYTVIGFQCPDTQLLLSVHTDPAHCARFYLCVRYYVQHLPVTIRLHYQCPQAARYDGISQKCTSDYNCHY